MTDRKPGSEAAIAAGCICPVIDNHYGRGFGEPPRFWLNPDWPLHGSRADSEEAERNQP